MKPQAGAGESRSMQILLNSDSEVASHPKSVLQFFIAVLNFDCLLEVASVNL
jgi:hypothetical protein